MNSEDYDEYPDDVLWEPDFDSDLRRLLTICNLITQTVPKAYFPQLFDDLLNATDAVEAWYENTDDPRENGWVDDKGRP